jgi:hypothetical protein
MTGEVPSENKFQFAGDWHSIEKKNDGQFPDQEIKDGIHLKIFKDDMSKLRIQLNQERKPHEGNEEYNEQAQTDLLKNYTS